MRTTHSLRMAFLSPLMIISTFSVAAHAATSAPLREVDAEDLYKKPVCAYDAVVKKSLEIQLGEVPTGIKESNAKWDMEIYSNPQDGSWTLVGKNKTPEGNVNKSCQLAKGLGNQPYTQKKWYRLYFEKNMTPK